MLNRFRFLPMGIALVTMAMARGSEKIQVPSVLIKLSEQVEVPAREAGVLENLVVHEGDMVAQGGPVAHIEDGDLRLEKRRAELEMDAARKQADSDVKVRYAKKTLEVAESDLRRATDSQKRLPQSVSQSELDQLRLAVQQNILEIEEADLELALARVALELKENDLAVADYGIAQRHITAPLAGFVAQVNRRRGEWVQPGQTVVRILRLDLLRAEGMIDAHAVRGELKGRTVKLSVKLDDEPQAEFTGKVVFVSPEVDPVNGQVRLWAEIENAKLKLRPGLHGSMVIDAAPPAGRTP
ncbi:MAG TPA: efflux RND transporter periplasmic adaptor subunit [Pirellulales bacterium]|jgi:macrolide-specific efflux system membrane fusion protein|nr:efflux RND transporter periplasmic adaptor subunit [Pirellulales bacterium]